MRDALSFTSLELDGLDSKDPVQGLWQLHTEARVMLGDLERA